MLITVLYRESGSGCDDTPVRPTPQQQKSGATHQHSTSDFQSNRSLSPADAGYNAFEFYHSGDSAAPAPAAGPVVVTLADLIKAFPFGPSYHFDILRRDNGMFESAQGLDLGSPVPMTADGVITCRVFRLACPPSYAPPGTGIMMPMSSAGGGGGGGSRGGDFNASSRGGRGGRGGRVGGDGGGGGGGKVVKDLKKNAGKATKGLLGFVGHAVQRTAEYLTHQEMSVGVYRVQIVREMAEGGEREEREREEGAKRAMELEFVLS